MARSRSGFTTLDPADLVDESPVATIEPGGAIEPTATVTATATLEASPEPAPTDRVPHPGDVVQYQGQSATVLRVLDPRDPMSALTLHAAEVSLVRGVQPMLRHARVETSRGGGVC